MGLLSNDRYYYFDVRGIVRIFDVEADDDGWSMVHMDEDFSQRHIARLRGADSMETTGEISRDSGATWQHDFRMTSQRVP